jgi:carnitine 3-dehydrogenase
MEHLTGPMAATWPALGDPRLTPELEQRIVDGVLKEADGRSIDELAARRDVMLVALQAVRATYEPSGGRITAGRGA